MKTAKKIIAILVITFTVASGMDMDLDDPISEFIMDLDLPDQASTTDNICGPMQED